MAALTFGIDISSNSATIDWQKVIRKFNPRFVFARAYHFEADPAHSYEDPLFARDYWPALERLRIPRGAYVYCHPEVKAEDLITAFFSVYTPKTGDIVPTLDIEDNYDNSCGVPLRDRIDQIATMIRLVSSRIGGQMPMIYTKARVWGDLNNPNQFSSCPLWVVNYQATPTRPVLPVSWPTYAFWQYAKDIKAKPDGIEDYDANYFNGPEQALRNCFIRQVTPRRPGPLVA
jgi:GH25 family lysozyme M1 (1,4-beta-N-acetylmuramidase)